MSAPAILNVEDNTDDVMLLKAACRAAKVQFRLLSVEDGDKAIAYLQGVDGYADRDRFPLPDLILLDLKFSESPCVISSR